MVKSFTTRDREKKVVEFEIDGEQYTFTAPKRAGLVASVVSVVGLDGRSTDADSLRDLLNWMSSGLPDDQAQRIIDRLNDPEDDFDLDQINEISRYLVGQTSNRPTKRRSDS